MPRTFITTVTTIVKLSDKQLRYLRADYLLMPEDDFESFDQYLNCTIDEDQWNLDFAQSTISSDRYELLDNGDIIKMSDY